MKLLGVLQVKLKTILRQNVFFNVNENNLNVKFNVSVKT
jgi:hypothetical protein